MCSVSVVTVVLIHTMEDDQRLNTLVHEGDTLHFSLQPCSSFKVFYSVLSWEKRKDHSYASVCLCYYFQTKLCVLIEGYV